MARANSGKSGDMSPQSREELLLLFDASADPSWWDRHPACLGPAGRCCRAALTFLLGRGTQPVSPQPFAKPGPPRTAIQKPGAAANREPSMGFKILAQGKRDCERHPGFSRPKHQPLTAEAARQRASHLRPMPNESFIPAHPNLSISCLPDFRIQNFFIPSPTRRVPPTSRIPRPAKPVIVAGFYRARGGGPDATAAVRAHGHTRLHS
jgi:hypothetical protein